MLNVQQKMFQTFYQQIFKTTNIFSMKSCRQNPLNNHGRLKSDRISEK